MGFNSHNSNPFNMTLTSLNRSQLPAILGLIVCGLMILAATPRLMSALYLLYPTQINEQYNKNPDSVNLEHHIKSAAYTQKALDWLASGSSWQILTLSKARQLNYIEPSARYKLSKEVYQANTQGLALSPIDPYGWYRLASIAQSINLGCRSPLSYFVGIV